MKTKFRVDSILVGTIERHLWLEDWLDEQAADKWELITIIPSGDNLLLVIHRRRKSWWRS